MASNKGVRPVIYMNRALELAKIAFDIGEVPVGAVVISPDGEIIGEGYNLRESSRNPLTHAEIIAIDNASKHLKSWRLIDCSIYITLEPCAMCYGAIVNARIGRIIFGAYDKKSGVCGSLIDLTKVPFNHMPVVEGGFMQEECSALLSDFFKELRASKKTSHI